MDDNDDGARIGVWVALSVVALLLFGLIGGLAMRSMQARSVAAPPPPVVMAPAAPAADVEAMVDVPLSGEIVATLFFGLDQSALQPDAEARLGPALQALAAAPGKRLVIAGFHDPSGDAAHNAELAKQRAMAVRAGLVALGGDAARVQLRKPEQTALGGPPDEARRVEVRLVD